MIIDDLEVDLCDGLRLIALLEVLSQKRIKRFNKKPKIRAQKMENVQLALDFIAYEKIKIVNIGTYLLVRVRAHNSFMVFVGVRVMCIDLTTCRRDGYCRLQHEADLGADLDPHPPLPDQHGIRTP